MPARLLVAYGLIALMALGVLAYAWWRSHNSQSRRAARARERLAERYRLRDEAAPESASGD
jgi:HAMP domain-containing protein